MDDLAIITERPIRISQFHHIASTQHATGFTNFAEFIVAFESKFTWYTRR
jgi:hypothetical protein